MRRKEHKDVYPAFEKIAEEEGFSEAASAFSQIAKIEKMHGERFAKLATDSSAGDVL